MLLEEIGFLTIWLVFSSEFSCFNFAPQDVFSVNKLHLFLYPRTRYSDKLLIII